MIIVYAPRDGETHRWNMKEVRLLATEAEAVERVTDLEWQKAQAKVMNGSMLALRAIAWVLMKRQQPDLRYVAFVPEAGELAFDYDADERAVIRENIAADEDLSTAEREAILAEFDEAEAALTAAGQAADSSDEDPEQVPKDSAATASPTAG